MKALIFTILCVIGKEVGSKKAILLNLRSDSLDEVNHQDADKKCPPYLTACPASTPQEIQFNKNFSLGRKSLFSRLIYAENESARNIFDDFCEKPVKPTMLYVPHANEYKIGFEIFYEDGKVNRRYYDRDLYYSYKPVITKNGKIHVLMNKSLPSSDDLVVQYDDRSDVKFNFTDGSRTLVFHWIEVFSVVWSKYKKLIPDPIYTRYGLKKEENLGDKCENYCSDDDDLYSKENQKKSLSEISAPPSLYNGSTDRECGHPFGCLKRSQIIPLWGFDSYSARLASCSDVNFVPVWKNIADGQLKKVDLYMLAIKKMVSNADLFFGVSGALRGVSRALRMKTSTKNSWAARKIYLFDDKRRRKVHIPKIIYRVVTLYTKYEQTYTAVIIIHNDPNADPKVDKLCMNDAISGWDKITNDDPKTGLTYTCPLTKELNEKLEASYRCSDINNMEPLNLDIDAKTHKISIYHETSDVDGYFEEILEKSKKYTYN